MEEDRKGDDQSLPGLEAVDACQDVDRVCTEAPEHCDVDLLGWSMVWVAFGLRKGILRYGQREGGDA